MDPNVSVSLSLLCGGVVWWYANQPTHQAKYGRKKKINARGKPEGNQKKQIAISLIGVGVGQHPVRQSHAELPARNNSILDARHTNDTPTTHQRHTTSAPNGRKERQEKATARINQAECLLEGHNVAVPGQERPS